jgi:hypothetical protein
VEKEDGGGRLKTGSSYAFASDRESAMKLQTIFASWIASWLREKVCQS